jgi:hypothetical protein
LGTSIIVYAYFTSWVWSVELSAFLLAVA